jgi:hypothetical protein
MNNCHKKASFLTQRYMLSVHLGLSYLTIFLNDSLFELVRY